MEATARANAGFEKMKEYIWRSQNAVVQYNTMQSLLDLYEATERTPGDRVGMHWWEQTDINLLGAREMAAAVEEADEGMMEE